MVYKIESVKDLEALSLINEDIKAILYYHAKVLDDQYGDFTSDGGYVLYATSEARCEDILSYGRIKVPIGGFVMPRRYRHIKEYENEILEMKSKGFTNREICKRYGWLAYSFSAFV